MNNRNFEALLGAAVGLALIIGFETLFVILANSIFNMRLSPRGIGWITMPIFAAIGGWKFGLDGGFSRSTKQLTSKVIIAPKSYRMWLALSIVWAVGVVVYVFAFQPYHYYWQDNDYTQFFATLVGPPALGMLGVVLLAWATKDRDL